MSALIQRRGDSGIPNKETAWAMLLELQKTREKEEKQLSERYDKIFNKYHGYWCGKEGGIVPEQRCNYCGGHTYEDHPKTNNKSVSRYGMSCHKKSASLMILELADFNTRHMWDDIYGYNTKDFLQSIQSRMDCSRDSWHWKGEFSIEELQMILDNQVKFGRICFCNQGKPTLTELGKKILQETPWSGMVPKEEKHDSQERL